LTHVFRSVAYFGVYEYLKHTLGSTTTAVLAAGGFAGVANWVVAIPPDVIKSRIQTAPNGTYNGISHAATYVARKCCDRPFARSPTHNG
jgi:solute carrier family 25 carnitine/acylcarnitine transporter 20/29